MEFQRIGAPSFFLFFPSPFKLSQPAEAEIRMEREEGEDFVGFFYFSPSLLLSFFPPFFPRPFLPPGLLKSWNSFHGTQA